MGDHDSTIGNAKLKDQATLGLLSALEGGENATQRSLAMRIGVALGLTNSLLKRCIRKGFVKVIEAPAKRYVYYVTPKGFGEKSRLVADYLSSSLSFFRQAKDEYGSLFQALKEAGTDEIILSGTGELAEIAVLAANEVGMGIRFILQPGSNLEHFCGYAVLNSLDAARQVNVTDIVVANTQTPQQAYDLLKAEMLDSAIHCVRLLHITKEPVAGGDDDA